ncbi:hypothetical protein [Actinocrispum wychmicini]|uniref:hypothetical protein n=1 Tax=Actinocrispum wychmicini TaxID=1213861 RepID=UPI00140526DB|nr:hypothetical protein [Actinocrispum wychmicini]
MGLIVYGWVQYLRHVEHLEALKKTADSMVAEVLRARSIDDSSASTAVQSTSDRRPHHG